MVSIFTLFCRGGKKSENCNVLLRCHRFKFLNKQLLFIKLQKFIEAPFRLYQVYFQITRNKWIKTIPQAFLENLLQCLAKLCFKYS